MSKSQKFDLKGNQKKIKFSVKRQQNKLKIAKLKLKRSAVKKQIRFNKHAETPRQLRIAKQANKQFLISQLIGGPLAGTFAQLSQIENNRHSEALEQLKIKLKETQNPVEIAKIKQEIEKLKASASSTRSDKSNTVSSGLTDTKNVDEWRSNWNQIRDKRSS